MRGAGRSTMARARRDAVRRRMRVIRDRSGDPRRLRLRPLVVHVRSTVRAEPISLGTKQFNIRGDDPVQPGHWMKVDVNRQARIVSFPRTMPHIGAGTIACDKA
jgi:hypothetical protein